MEIGTMDIHITPLPDLLTITTKKHDDDRGFFVETYRKSALAAFGFGRDFVQDNHSLSRQPGVLRGLHFQTPPFAQDKLIRVTRGAIWDVAVDIRSGSPTYGRHYGLELSDANGLQLLVPIGFAHGFLTLAADTEVQYKVSQGYAPQSEGGIIWNDTDLGIAWPKISNAPLLSPKDVALPAFSQITTPFRYSAADET